jgi:thiol-disulfide isomerase/thioredoxin
LVSQGFFYSGDPTANPVAKSNKLKKHYKEVIKGLKLETFDKKKVDLSKPPKVLIVNFWASWCTPCLEEFPSLNKLLAKYDNGDLQVLGVNTDEKEQNRKIEKIKEKYTLEFPLVADKDGKLINDFLVTAIPLSIIYHNGEMVEVSHGSKDFYSEEFLEKMDSWLN